MKMCKILFANILLLLNCMGFTQHCFAEEYLYKEISKNQIETERLILEPTNSSDLDVLSDYLMDHEVTKYLDPTIKEGFSDKKQALEFLKSENEHEYNEAMSFTIKLKESKKPIGEIDAMIYFQGSGNMVMFGYWLGKDFHGKGYAQEACYSFCDKFFKASDVNSVYISCHSENEKSSKLANKILDYLEKNNSHLKLFREQQNITIEDEQKNQINVCTFLLKKVQR